MKSVRFWPVTLLVVTVVVVICGALFARGRGGKTEKIDQTLVSTVSKGDLEISVTELGKIKPREEVAIKSKVAGQVQKILVEEGMQVEQGQLLLVLDPIDFQRNVVRARQDVDKANAALEFAVLTLDRRKRGLTDRGVAQADVDFAENDLKTKKIAVAQSKEILAAAEDQMRFSRITSPMTGTITVRTIQSGETVVPGVAATFDDKSLMTVADLSVLLAKAELNQIDVAKVRLGQEVTLTLDALPGKSYKAKVTKIAPASVLPKGKDVEVFPVEATLVGSGSGKELAEIRPGMTADVKIHIETKKGVLRLPIEAVVKEKGKTYVTQVTDAPGGKGQRTDKKEVQLGARNDRDQEILSGLSEGDKVLIKPPSAEANEFK